MHRRTIFVLAAAAAIGAAAIAPTDALAARGGHAGWHGATTEPPIRSDLGSVMRWTSRCRGPRRDIAPGLDGIPMNHV